MLQVAESSKRIRRRVGIQHLTRTRDTSTYERLQISATTIGINQVYSAAQEELKRSRNLTSTIIQRCRKPPPEPSPKTLSHQRQQPNSAPPLKQPPLHKKQTPLHKLPPSSMPLFAPRHPRSSRLMETISTLTLDIRSWTPQAEQQ